MRVGPDWLTPLTPDDLDVFGLEYEAGESPQDAVIRYARAFDVDLDQVGRCLDFLRSGPVMLCGGAPVAILAWSPRTGRWQASFDGDTSDDIGEFTTPRAGVWLTLLASEIGTLPTDAEHPLALGLPPGFVSEDAETDTVQRARAYAQVAVDPPPSGYDALIGAAFWRCVGHALR